MKSKIASLNSIDPERNLEFEFVRATENAALNVVHWLGRGKKEKADAAACDAIDGVFDLIDIRGEVVIGEGSRTRHQEFFSVVNWAIGRRTHHCLISRSTQLMEQLISQMGCQNPF